MFNQKESFVFYFDWLDHLSLLEPSEAVAVLEAIRNYIVDGESDSGLEGAARMVFSFLKAQVDRDLVKWEDTRRKRSEAGKTGAESTNKHRSSAKVGNAEQCPAKAAKVGNAEQCPANPAVTVPVPVPVPVNSESMAGKPPSRSKSKPERKQYGQYGWVKLSQEEYSRLSNDLGENELKRCIAYLDESAQSTGNKNKWRDWNLVIRRCSRDHWGLKDGTTPAERVPGQRKTCRTELVNGEEVDILADE